MRVDNDMGLLYEIMLGMIVVAIIMAWEWWTRRDIGFEARVQKWIREALTHGGTQNW